MRYANARFEQDQRELAYRFYIADSLFASGDGKHLTKSYGEIMNEIGRPVDNRPAEAIVNDSLYKLGIKVI